MDERVEAVALANRLLDVPYADPDDDLRVLSRQLLRRHEEIEQLRAAMWKYGKHLSVCTIHTTRIPAHSCSCGWSQIRETLAGEAKRPPDSASDVQK